MALWDVCVMCGVMDSGSTDALAVASQSRCLQRLAAGVPRVWMIIWTSCFWCCVRPPVATIFCLQHATCLFFSPHDRIKTTDCVSTLIMTEIHTNGHSHPPPTAADLLQRCQTLLSELETFKEYLKSRKQDHQVEIAHFRNTVKSELRTLQRLTSAQEASAQPPTTSKPTGSVSEDEDGDAGQDADEKQQTTQHTVNSSNLPFLENVWGVVKNNTGLQAMQKRFYWQEKGMKRGQKKQNSALVDVVAGDGLQWFKVSLLTNNRLLFDKAKLGWEDASSSEDEDEDEDSDDEAEPKQEFGSKKDEADDNDVPLVKMTKDLVRAAREVKIRTRSPRITLVLPKLREGEVVEIDRILDQLRSLGVHLL